MNKNFWVSLAFIIIFFSSITATVQAQFTSEAQTCLAPANGINCDTYLDSVISCLDNVNSSNFVWACQDFDQDAYIDPLTEVPVCREKFAQDVCSNIGGLNTRTCKDVCSNTSRDYLSRLNGIYSKKYNERTASLISPTPTPLPNSVITQDICTQSINSGNDCRTTIRQLDECYEALPPESGVWSCTTSNGSELPEDICRDSWILRVQNSVEDKLFNKCLGGHGGFPDDVTRVYSYSTIQTEFDKKRTLRLQPTISPTPGIVDQHLHENINRTPNPNTAKQAAEVLNCGFANADDEAKQKCCPQEISDLDFDRADNAIDCGWFDLQCQATQRLQLYIQKDIIEKNLNETKDSYNQIIADNDGTLPKCFVGTCELVDGINKCVKEDAAAICYRYLGEENEDVLSKCTACMGNNDDEGANKMFYSAIGCIDTSFEGIVAQVFTLGIGIAGLVALGCIIYSSFLMQTSGGSPEQIQKAQENITSCITGLILIILSMLILRILGVDILRIPGFGQGGTPTPTVAPTLSPTQVPTPTPTLVPGPPLASPTPGDPPTPTMPPPILPVVPLNYNCTGSDPGESEIYLYDELNFGGPCLRVAFELSMTDVADLRNISNNATSGSGPNWFGSCNSQFNDCIESIKVGSKVTVSLYQHINFEGTVSSYVGSGNVSNRNGASSLKVSLK